MAASGEVVAPDGTVLRAWDNEAAGTPVVVSNGLGASPSAWPFLDDPGCGFHTVTWHHRGLGGSQRPVGESHIRIADHAGDLEAVMDAAGMSRALVIGWSVGGPGRAGGRAPRSGPGGRAPAARRGCCAWSGPR